MLIPHIYIYIIYKYIFRLWFAPVEKYNHVVFILCLEPQNIDIIPNRTKVLILT